MSRLLPAHNVRFNAEAEVLVIGAGACGLIAALAARENHAEVVILERDASPSGSTALSSGFIPAAPTRYQHALGITDSSERFAADIQRKANHQAVQSIVDLASKQSALTIEWLADRHGLEWIVLDEFLYPGHSVHRMHATPERTGAALMARLANAVNDVAIPISCNATVSALYADGVEIKGAQVLRPNGTTENIACRALVLACNGFGGNTRMVAEHIPEMANALYFGHRGNQGDAVLWGRALGAALEHLSAYQGHGAVAHPHGILITWALMMRGAIQVNINGRRFSNEHQGYSEQAVNVLREPRSIAWNIYDASLHELGMTFEDYRQAVAAGAIKSAPTLSALANKIDVPAAALETTLEAMDQLRASRKTDEFGRDFTDQPQFSPPFYAVKVTGALFHTQGGLLIDDTAKVLAKNRQPLPNLYAGGGAACGVSGPAVSGYLSGNGLLTATTLGHIAGVNAARAATR